MKSRKYVDDLIMRVILEEERKLLQEDIRATPSEFYQAFIQPWIDVFKVIKLQTQVVINNVLYAVRLMSAKTEEERKFIKDRHDGRVAELMRETQNLIGDQKELDLALFLINPGAYCLGSTGLYFYENGLRDAEEFFRQAGFEDLPPSATPSSPEGAESRMTYGQLQVPAAGLLQRLQKLFTESSEIDLTVPFVVPGDKNMVDSLNKAVETGPLGAKFKKMREDLIKNYTESQRFVEGIVPQAEFLANLSKVKDEKQLAIAIGKLESEVRKKNDKAEIKGYKELPKAFQSDLKKLLSDPKARETAKKQLEERKAKDKKLVINDALIDQELKSAAWAKTMQALTSGTAEQLKNFVKMAEDTFAEIDLEKKYKDKNTREQLNGTQIYDAYEKSKAALEKLKSIKA